MPPAAMVGIALAASAAQAYGQHKEQKQQNKYAQQGAGFMSPQGQQSAMAGLNPMLWSALTGNDISQQFSNSPLYAQLKQMAENPGYMDPTLMNVPYTQSAQRQQSDLSNVGSMLGRSGMQGGGLSNAYVLANQAARTARDTETSQKYSLFREQQRRSDLGSLMEWLGQLQNYAGGLGQSRGKMIAGQQAPTSGWSMLGNAGLSGLSAYSMFPQQSKPPATSYHYSGYPQSEVEV